MFSWSEYSVHPHCGHVNRGWRTLFYKRHTGDHHSFFVEGQMVCHVCEQLSEDHWIARLPGVKRLDRLHALHHQRDLVQAHNFNITLPLVDWLKGPLHWERRE